MGPLGAPIIVILIRLIFEACEPNPMVSRAHAVPRDMAYACLLARSRTITAIRKAPLSSNLARQDALKNLVMQRIGSVVPGQASARPT